METLTKQNIESKIENIFNSNDNIDYMYISENLIDTLLLGKIIAKHLKTGDILSLNGELGSGKTVFMQGIAKYFDIEKQISSPTFTIVNEYLTNDNKNIYHFDVYRLQNEDEFLEGIGTDYFSNGICIIEWGDIIKKILPDNTLFIDITKDNSNDSKRYLHIWRKK